MEEREFKVYRVEKNVSEKEFLKKALEKLAYQRDIPIDIYDSKFGKVRCEYKEFLGAVTNVEIDYTCSVGYNKQELKEEYDSTSGTYQKRSRTVTDWSPYQGRHTSEEIAIVMNGNFDTSIYGENGEDLANGLKFYLCEYDLDGEELSASEVDEKYQNIDDDAIRNIKQKCLDYGKSSIRTPGDEKKDVMGSGQVQIKSLEKWVVPVYSLEYQYRGQNYYISGLAVTCAGAKNELYVVVTSPQEKVDVEKNVKKKSRWIKLSAIIPAVVAIIMAISSRTQVATGCAVGAILVLIAGFIFDKIMIRREGNSKSIKLKKSLDKYLIEKKLK